MSNKAEGSGLVPKLRFPEFREAGAWKEKKIGKALIEQPRPIDMDEEGEYSLVTVKRRYGGVVSRGVFKGRSIKVKTQFLLQENDFLISKRQIVHCACGVVPKALDGSIVSNEYSVLRARDGFDVTFFDYFAQQPKVSQSFLRCSIGIVIEKMLFKLNDWLKEEFLFPSLPEQQKIAYCLASLDELLTLEAQKLDTLKTHKKGLMQQLFPGEGKTLPKLRFPEFQNAGEWHSAQLDELISTVTPPKKIPTTDYLLEGRFPIIDQGQSDIAGWTNDPGSLVEANQPLIVFGDHTCALKLVKQSFAQGADGIKIISGRKLVDPDFLYQFLSSQPVIQEEYKRHFSVLKAKIVTYPDRKTGEQQRIADFLASLDDLITAQTQKLATLKTHKKGLMQQLFPALDEAAV